jgi:MHS family proline/betaine transporter-like MFS transporter
MASAVAAEPGASRSARVAVAGSVGQLVEWYDYSVYAYFAAVIGRLFFPSRAPYASLLLSFAVFGVGFVMRPLGSAVFAHYGDRFGRRNALAVSIVMMALCTLAIGLLPDAASIGAAAPVLLVVCRLLQGLSAGGEVAGASCFLVEHAPAGRRGLVASGQQVGVAGGVLLGSAIASLLTLTLSEQQVVGFGWRIPFVLGTAAGLVGLYLRVRSPETPAFERAARAGRLSERPLATVFREHPIAALTSFAFGITPSVTYYVWLIYFPSYARAALHMAAGEAQLANTIALAVYLASILPLGWLSDRVGRRPLLLGHAVAFGVISYPLLWLLAGHPTFWALTLAEVAAAIAMGLWSGPAIAALGELFPTPVRYSGISVPYNVSVAAFGGTAGFVATAILVASHSAAALASYVIAACLVALVTYGLMPETSRRELA